MTILSMQQELRKAISAHGLDAVAEQLIATASPAIRLVKEPSNPLKTGSSRLGGLPDVPPDFDWPYFEGRPLTFLTQLSCRELGSFDAEQRLPSSGTLYFFYEAMEQPWGFEPKHKGGAIVLHSASESLTPASAPATLPREAVLQPIPITFERFLSLPGWGSSASQQFQFEDGQTDSYFRLLERFRSVIAGGHHQLFGHANIIQNEMELECQLASHGVYCGDSTYRNDPRTNALKAGAAEWRLLLQFDSDEDLGVMWGDIGMIYFWIRESDLRTRSFDQCWTILQCS